MPTPALAAALPGALPALLPAFTFNQLSVPLLGSCVFALIAVAFWVRVRRETLASAQLQRLGKLKPPRKTRNHRSLPVRQYYLTRNLSKATPGEELLLEVYVKLFPGERAPASPGEKLI